MWFVLYTFPIEKLINTEHFTITMKLFIVMPAYNEGKVIASVIKSIQRYQKKIVVVDDCSSDNTYAEAKKQTPHVLRHEINRGAGAATKTGIDYALSQGATHIITMDADGQHDPKDIDRLLQLKDKYDVIIGSRMIQPKGMPLSRKILNWGGSLITYLLYGIFVWDSQTGFKLFSKKAAQSINITFDRYEFCSEVLHEIRRNRLSYKEVPIKVIYTEYSLSKGQHVSNGFRMVYKMIMRLFV